MEGDAVPAETLRFEGSSFPAGERARAAYTFNSCRGTYRYLVHESSVLQGWVGELQRSGMR